MIAFHGDMSLNVKFKIQYPLCRFHYKIYGVFKEAISLMWSAMSLRPLHFHTITWIMVPTNGTGYSSDIEATFMQMRLLICILNAIGLSEWGGMYWRSYIITHAALTKGWRWSSDMVWTHTIEHGCQTYFLRGGEQRTTTVMVG